MVSKRGILEVDNEGIVKPKAEDINSRKAIRDHMKHMPEVLQYHVLIVCVVPSLLLTGQTITTIVG